MVDKTTVAAPVTVLTADQTLTARDCGFQFARNQLANIETAQSFARNLGTEPTYDQWEESRTAWVAGYVEANPDNTGNAADKAWNRFTGLLDELFGLVKPKAVSAAAEKKRAEREAKQKELLAKHGDMTVTMLRAQQEAAYQTLAKNPANKEAQKQVKELEKVLKVKQSAENKEHGEELRTARAAVKAAAGKCIDIDALDEALRILIKAAAE